MTRFWIGAALFLMVLTNLSASAQTQKQLTDLKPVTHAFQWVVVSKPFSLGGRVMQYGLTNDWDTASTVYDLGGKYTRFEAFVGVPDNGPNDKHFSIMLDGKLVLDNKNTLCSGGDPPMHVILNVTGVQSLKITGDGWIHIGEPM